MSETPTKEITRAERERLRALAEEALAAEVSCKLHPETVLSLLAALDEGERALEESERGADDLQGEVDELADWQRRVCELLTPEGDRGALSSDLAEARIWEL